MRLSEGQLARYFDEGFLVVEGVLSETDLAPARQEIEEHVEQLAQQLYEAGRVGSTHAGLDFFHRLTALESEYPGAAVLLHFQGVLGPGIASLWGSPKLLDMVEQLIGPDIIGHPVCNIRSKTPRTELMTVPWHQDTAYLLAGAERTLQPTAWVPFLDATRETGCIQVARGAHRAGRVFPHRAQHEVGNPQSWYLYIPEAELAAYEVVTCEVPLGGVLLLNQLIPHRSLENHSDRIRWSVDLRWQRPNEPAGWEGYIDPVVLRRAGDPGFVPDWDGYFRQREQVFREKFRTHRSDPFDIVVKGPWLDRWRDAAA